jgi:two-component system, OmpR family, sensor histidine kinase KdpD
LRGGSAVAPTMLNRLRAVLPLISSLGAIAAITFLYSRLVPVRPATVAVTYLVAIVADYLHADCLAVCVTKTRDVAALSPEERDHLQRHLNFARGLQIDTRIIQGEDVAETVAAFARLNGVTQIFVIRQRERTMRSLFAEGLVQQIVNLAQDMQVTVVADRSARRGES